MVRFVHEQFLAMCERFPDHPFVGTPPNPERAYLPEGRTYTYEAAAKRIDALEQIYRDAGFGHGHRLALQIENHPDFYLHRMALHRIGTCLVPLNQDYAVPELQHVFHLTEPEVVVLVDRHRPRIEEALAGTPHASTLVRFEDVERSLPSVQRRAPDTGPLTERTETTILFTSGTTGKPKGCRFDHAYELAACEWYRTRGGLLDFRMGEERLYSPLPLFHSNTGVHAFLEMLATGGALMTSDRFRSQRYWQEVNASQATCIHYLGVIMAMLYRMEPTADERSHTVRFAIGAGVDPALHAEFEKRFGFPLLELWGMTETMRFLMDCVEPRKVGTRAFGRSQPGLEARTVGDSDIDVAVGTPGELVVRHSAETPRHGFFAGYLKDPEATEQAWRGGWLHTGDMAIRDEDGVFHFLDRKKHIIRRAGQNIAAAEVDAAMNSHPGVVQCAAIPVQDEVREEEVLVCIVPAPGFEPGPELALSIFEHSLKLLAYYKAPGWVLFVEELPKTGSQKIMKFALFPPGVDPRKQPGIVDLRSRKKRPPEGTP